MSCTTTVYRVQFQSQTNEYNSLMILRRCPWQRSVAGMTKSCIDDELHLRLDRRSWTGVAYQQDECSRAYKPEGDPWTTQGFGTALDCAVALVITGVAQIDVLIKELRAKSEETRGPFLDKTWRESTDIQFLATTFGQSNERQVENNWDCVASYAERALLLAVQNVLYHLLNMTMSVLPVFTENPEVL